MPIREYERVEVTSRAEWRRWLERNHTRTESIWLVTWKKATPAKHVPYAEVVEEALCFGWIDSQPAKLDEARSMLRLSPRRKGSAWSALNKERVERLTAAGLMHPSGLAKVAEARADGAWRALDEVSAGVIPAEIPAAARARLEAMSPSARRGWLDRYRQAKTEPTRAKRISELIR